MKPAPVPIWSTSPENARHQPVALLVKSFPFTALGFSPLEGGTHGDGGAAIQPSRRPPAPRRSDRLIADNLGDADVNGSGPVRSPSTDQPAPGLTATAVEGHRRPTSPRTDPVCSLASLSCTFAETRCRPTPRSNSVVIGHGRSRRQLRQRKPSRRSPAAAPPPPRPPSRSPSAPTPTPFGIEDYGLRPEEVGGGPTPRPAPTPSSSPPRSTSTRPQTTAGPTRASSACPRTSHFELPPGLHRQPDPVPPVHAPEFQHVYWRRAPMPVPQTRDRGRHGHRRT